MNYLLDSHAMLWFLFMPGKLSATCKSVLEDPGNEIHISHMSYWEISLKYAMGKFDLYGYTPEDLPVECKNAGFKNIPLTENDAITFYKLPFSIHKDPFDRMLAWQAINHKLTLLSKDRNLKMFENFGLKVIW